MDTRIIANASRIGRVSSFLGGEDEDIFSNQRGASYPAGFELETAMMAA
jgi:hypothetical protein